MKLNSAQIERLRSLETEHGGITPDAVVSDAKQQDSPLHSLFEWNVQKAAAKYWIETAREVIASVTLIVTTTTHTLRAPNYVRDPSATGQGYRSVVALKSEPERAREVVIATLDVAAGHIRRAFDLAETLGVEKDIDQLLEQIVGLRRKIEVAA
jgi:hypothetical protein